MKRELIEKAYEIAKERYAAVGVDTESAIDALQKISLSLHCWQADDVRGFDEYINRQLDKVDVPDVTADERAYMRQMVLMMYANPVVNQLRANGIK